VIEHNIIWTRFRVVFASAPSAYDTLNRIARALDLDLWPLSFDDRATAASYLRRLARSPKALEAVAATGPGRPRGAGHPSYLIAIDYLARMRMRKGKRDDVIEAVRKDWSKPTHCSADTVTRAIRTYRYAANLRIDELIRLGTSESTPLDAVLLSLADHRRASPYRMRKTHSNKGGNKSP
jgi:hypothetical protein